MAESTALVKARQELQAKKAQMIGLNQDAATGLALPPATVQALVAWAERYELDAYAGHVILYRGKPFVTAEGAVAYGARKLGIRYQGFSCEPLKWEDLKAMGYSGEKGDCGWRCNVFVKDFVVPITDYGIVTNDDIESAIKAAGTKAQYLPLVKTPMLLAKARAIRRAFKLACPLDSRAAEVLAEPGEMAVNGETGEIVDPPQPAEPKPGTDPAEWDVNLAAEPEAGRPADILTDFGVPAVPEDLKAEVEVILVLLHEAGISMEQCQAAMAKRPEFKGISDPWKLNPEQRRKLRHLVEDAKTVKAVAKARE